MRSLNYDNMDNWPSLEWCIDSDAFDYPEPTHYEEEPQPRIWLGDYVRQEEYDKALELLSKYEAGSEFAAAIRAARIVEAVTFGAGASRDEIAWAVDELVSFSQQYDDENWIEPLTLDWNEGIGNDEVTAKMIIVYTADTVEYMVTSRAA